VLEKLVDRLGADLRQTEAFRQGDVDAQVNRTQGEKAEEREEDDQSGKDAEGDPEAEAQSLETTHRPIHLPST
jgi:hypothetical protein